MARINLLPWRDIARKRRQKEFGLMLVSGLVFAVLVSLYVHLHIANMIDHQKQRNALLESEISLLNKKIKEIQNLEKTKANLIARMEIIQQLQESRPEIVHLMDELVNTLPEGVFLTKVSQNGRSIQLDGRAQSNARVSSYMRNIDASAWLGNANLKIIQQGGNRKESSTLSQFNLTAKQIKPKTTQVD
jgi:type IV pilus assembly protein PilN